MSTLNTLKHAAARKMTSDMSAFIPKLINTDAACLSPIDPKKVGSLKIDIKQLGLRPRGKPDIVGTTPIKEEDQVGLGHHKYSTTDITLVDLDEDSMSSPTDPRRRTP